MDNRHQNNRKALTQENKGEAQTLPAQGDVLSAALQSIETSSGINTLMEAICDRENLKQALIKVRQNKGAPGIDGMTVDDLIPYLKEHWVFIKEQLFRGTYKPQPVRQVEIPKPGGKGVRLLGIPVVVDRFIQQAILQVLQRVIDPTFSKNSYGFRPRKSPQQAVAKAQEYIAQGYRVVVDIDLKNFFNTVNHDKLMSELSKRINDKRVLKIIRSYLNAGTMQNGLVRFEEAGTPQGGPLSPLLSNVMLDLLDKELEKRGHRFCRFADDCNVYVKSERAGNRVMESLQIFLTNKLKLQINKQKSAVAKFYRRSFLGFGFTSGKTPKRRIAPEAIKRLKKKIRDYTRASKGMCMERVIINLSKYLKGWLAYYGFCQTPSILKDLEGWIHRRLRCAFWRQWKKGRNRGAQLRRRGVEFSLSIQTAGTNKGPWHISKTLALNIAMPGEYFRKLGIPKLVCLKPG